jgi:catechol 2,3-dioxygenase-like lactoylglutathione lyase family enzyme
LAINRFTPELLCQNLKRSLNFYVGIAGFTVLFERPEHGFAYLEREGVQIMLEQIGAEREWITGELSYPFGRGINFQIGVSDVDALYQSVLQVSWPVYLALEEKWYRQNMMESGNRQFLVQDPDGYLLRFAQDLGRRPHQGANKT